MSKVPGINDTFLTSEMVALNPELADIVAQPWDDEDETVEKADAHEAWMAANGLNPLD